MKKLFGMLVLAMLGLSLAPSCSSADSFEEVVMESNLDSSTINYTTDSQEGGKKSKPGS